jgi:hypothetical protein
MAKKASKESTFISCTARLLSPLEQSEASRAAKDIEPRNDIGRFSLIPPHPEFIIGMRSKFWPVTTKVLPVYFRDSSMTQALRNKILTYANKWTKYSGLSFSESNDPSSVIRLDRISGDGYWSYIGTDCSQIPKNQQTLNLDSFSERTPDSEFDRVVVHEFGHARGYWHEHLRPSIIELLDRQKVLKRFKQLYGWDDSTTIPNVLTPISEDNAVMKFTANANVRSVMCYDFDGSMTKNGKPIPGGSVVLEEDLQFDGQIYPGAVVPPTDGVMPGINEQGNLLVNLQNVARMLDAVGYKLVKK